MVLPDFVFQTSDAHYDPHDSQRSEPKLEYEDLNFLKFKPDSLNLAKFTVNSEKTSRKIDLGHFLMVCLLKQFSVDFSKKSLDVSGVVRANDAENPKEYVT